MKKIKSILIELDDGTTMIYGPYDQFECEEHEERRVDKVYAIGSDEVVDMMSPNGHRRITIKAWDGNGIFDEFAKEIVEWEEVE